MTHFYCFPETQSISGDFVRPDGISVSVIGDVFDEEEQFIHFLVNTNKPVQEWEEYECFPETPLRIFG